MEAVLFVSIFLVAGWAALSALIAQREMLKARRERDSMRTLLGVVHPKNSEEK
jgi:hypothetical protein